MQVRRLVLRAASPASDERENVQDCRNAANVSSGTVKALFHSGMTIRKAFDAFAHTPQAVNFPQKILESRGHDVDLRETPFGGGQAIRIDRARGVLIGGSDARKDGCALGY